MQVSNVQLASSPLQRVMHGCRQALANSIRPPYTIPDVTLPPAAFYARHPLAYYERALNIIPKQMGICPECKKVFSQQTANARLQLWKDLPRIFNVVRAPLPLARIVSHLPHRSIWLVKDGALNRD